jgi:hypothetical protein
MHVGIDVTRTTAMTDDKTTYREYKRHFRSSLNGLAKVKTCVFRRDVRFRNDQYLILNYESLLVGPYYYICAAASISSIELCAAG